MNKSFRRAIFQEGLHPISTKHLYNHRKTNKNLMQDYQLAKPDYFSTLWSYKKFVVLNSRTEDTMIKNTIIIFTSFSSTHTVVLLTTCLRILSRGKVGTTLWHTLLDTLLTTVQENGVNKVIRKQTSHILSALISLRDDCLTSKV